MRLRRLSIRAGFAAATAFALVPLAEAQWLPFGAAPPREIVQRLRAEGYVLVGPLRRRDTVYLVDVAGGPVGRERLVIDAWSGEILQRFVARGGGFVPEGGEFSEPPPLGPPPPRDFREGNYGNGPGGPGATEAPQKARPRPRSPATARRGAEPKLAAPAAQPAAPPQSAGAGAAAPAQAAPPGAAAPTAAVSPPAAPANPNLSEPAKVEPSPPKAAEPAREAQPQPAAAPSAPAEARQSSPPPRPAPANSSPASVKPGDKKVNDLPVNPLD